MAEESASTENNFKSVKNQYFAAFSGIFALKYESKKNSIWWNVITFFSQFDFPCAWFNGWMAVAGASHTHFDRNTFEDRPIDKFANFLDWFNQFDCWNARDNNIWLRLPSTRLQANNAYTCAAIGIVLVFNLFWWYVLSHFDRTVFYWFLRWWHSIHGDFVYYGNC